MPFNDALFWFGLTAFGTGLYYLWDASVKRLHSIAMTVIGTLGCAYSVYHYEHPESPAIRLWVILLLLTWALMGYSIYLRRPLSAKSTGIGAEWRAAFSRPRFGIVDGHKFENEEIVVDNKSFRKCSFKNVKLLFHGHAPFEFVEGTTIDAGTVFFTTDDPAVMVFNTIQAKFASLPGAKVEHGALDSKGKDIPLTPLTVEPVSRNFPRHVLTLEKAWPEGPATSPTVFLKNKLRMILTNHLDKEVCVWTPLWESTEVQAEGSPPGSTIQLAKREWQFDEWEESEKICVTLPVGRSLRTYIALRPTIGRSISERMRTGDWLGAALFPVKIDGKLYQVPIEIGRKP